MVNNLLSNSKSMAEIIFWTDQHKKVIKYIRETIGLTEYSEEAIENVLCIFLCNDFSISRRIGDHDWSSCENNGIRGLYELGCILNHDCVGNTIHQFTSWKIDVVWWSEQDSY